MSTMRRRLSAWVALSRPPFHSVGVLPFILGSVLAWRLQGRFNWRIGAWGVLGVVFVMLAAYHAGEYWDYVEDTLSSRVGSSRFAGGSQVVQRGLLPHRAPLWGSMVSVAMAVIVAVVLHVGYGIGPWAIPFGVIGLLGGFFYSTRPIRWVRTGIGELWIAFCYGWLPVAVGYYLQVGELATHVHWLSIPIGLTIFNVILLNEFPDYAADTAAGKTNLVVRLGRRRSARLYAVISIGSWVATWMAARRSASSRLLALHLPIVALSSALVVLLLRGRWRDSRVLERLCGANLAVNLGTTAVFIAALIR